MSDDPFLQICGTLDGPMVIVTANDGRERSGCLVGFSTQCSIDPRRWLVCISKLNHTLGVAQRAPTLAIHLLREDQLPLARLFGGTTEDVADKFAHCAWRDGPDGVPLLDGCDWVAGEVLQRIDTGDHVAHIVAVRHSGQQHAPAPQLGFQLAKTIDAGHPPDEGRT
jgi:flavin reductase (DIM6/NTAB) family NADH-FMN oxidoreductase RutF